MKTNIPRAFTLIELLTVIAIIGILAAIVIAVVPSVRNSAASASCASNLRQLGTLMLLHANDHKDRFPPIRPDTTPGYTELYWRRAILPYMGLPAGGESIYHSKLTCPVVRQAIEAVGGKPDICSFGVNIYLSEPENSRKTRGIRVTSLRNPGQTLMATESFLQSAGTPAPNLQQSDFRNAAYDVYWNPHKGAQNLLYCDGHVKSFRNVQQIGAAPYNPNSPLDIWTP